MTYTPKVGDRVRGEAWPAYDWVDVRYVDPEGWFAGVATDGHPGSFRSGDWQLVPPPPVKVRESWVRDDGGGYSTYDTRSGVEFGRSVYGGTVTQLRVIDSRDIPDDIRVLALCHEDGTPANVEAVES